MKVDVGSEERGSTIGYAGRRAQDKNACPVPFHKAWIGVEEERAIVRVLREGKLRGDGPIGRAVEVQLCHLLQVRHALLVSSCTAALETALAILDVAGGEVILPSLSFPSVAAATVAAGACPVFVDIEADSLSLDPQRLAKALSARTRAVICVEYGGHPGTLPAVRDLVNHHGVPLIEDAAHALGSQYQNRPLGSWGTVGCFSFDGTKVATCGEGGLFVTDNDRLAEAAGINREYGTNRSAFFRGVVDHIADHYDWVAPGSNRLLSEPLAALLQEQLKKLPIILQRRRLIAQRYLKAFSPVAAAGDLALPVHAPETQANWQTFHVLVQDRQTSCKFLKALAQHGIDARRHFAPLHLSTYAQRYRDTTSDCPVSESVAARLIRLPIYPTLTEMQQERVIKAVLQFFSG